MRVFPAHLFNLFIRLYDMCDVNYDHVINYNKDIKLGLGASVNII